MDSQQNIEQLRNMMRAYESPQHNVVALSLRHGESEIISSGPQTPDVSPDALIFEIGSITKVFTAILLCLMVEDGKVDPQAPLRDMSDQLADVPSWITPESLMSHTSGLPRLHVPIWKALLKPLPKDPYAEFSRSDLLAWFKNGPAKAPGPKLRHAYSNFGIGLLGEAIAMKEGRPFMELLSDQVIAPLGLRDTSDLLNQEQRSRFMQPKTTSGKPAAPWTFQAMAAAGCLRSTAADIGRFSDRVIQALNAPDTPLDRAICRSAVPVFGLGPNGGPKGGMEPAAQCSGWMSMKLEKAGPRFIHHDGGTAGSTSALYICPEKSEAIAVLSNNGIAASLWGSAKLSWSNQLRQAHEMFSAG